MFTAKESLSVTAVYKQKKINLHSLAQCTVNFTCLVQCSFTVMAQVLLRSTLKSYCQKYEGEKNLFKI